MRLRRLAIGVLALCASLLLLTAAAALALSFGWQRDWLRGRLERFASEQAGAGVEIGALEGPLHRAFRLRDVAVVADAEPVVALSRVDVAVEKIEIWPRPRLLLSSLEVDEAALHLRRGAGGTWNVERFVSPSSAAPEPAVGLAWLEIQRLEVRAGRLDLRLDAGKDVSRLLARFGLVARDVVLPFESVPALDFDLQVDEAVGPEVALSEANLRGRVEAGASLEAELSLAARNLVLRGVALGDAEARLRTSGGDRIEVEAFELRGGRLPVRADAGARLRRDGDALVIEKLRLESGEAQLQLVGRVGSDRFDALQVEASGIEVEPLAALAGSPQRVSGRLAASLRLDGAYERPRVDGTLRWQKPRIGELRFDALAFDIATRHGRFQSQLRAVRDGAPIVDGRVVLPRTLGAVPLADLLANPVFDLEVALEPVALGPLRPFLPASLQTLDGQVEGSLSLGPGRPWPVVRRGTLKARNLTRPGDPARDLDIDASSDASGAIRIETLRLVQGERSLAVEPGARLRPRDGGVAIDSLVMGVEGHRIEASGAIAANGFDGLRVQTRGSDLASLVALFDAAEGVEGRLDVDLELNGSFASPGLQGTIEVTTARIGGVGFDRLDLSVETPDHRVRALGVIERDGRKLLDLRVVLPREPARIWSDGRLVSEALDLAIEAEDLEIALLAPLLARTLRDPVGTLAGRLRFSEGRPEGEMTLTGGGVGVPGIGRLEPITARVRFDAAALRIQHFRIGGEEGEAKITGRIEHTDLRPTTADLDLLLDRFAVSQPGLWRGRLSGRIEAVGPVDGIEARGELRFGGLELRIPDAEDPALKEIRIVSSADAPTRLREASEPGAFERADLDLTVTVPEKSWVRGNGAEFEVAGDLRLSKRPLAQLLYDGGLRVVRGSYRLHGKRFLLREGSATLAGDTEPDPHLEIEAVHSVADVRIVARVQGRASNPEVRLASEPPLPDADVLAYLLFGRSAAAVAGGQQAALTAAAAQVAAGLAADRLQALLGDIVPVDTVDIEIQEDGSLAELGVGRYLGDRIFVRYGRSLGTSPEDRVGVAVRLTPSWSIESDVSSSGSAGVDLIWTRDY